MIELKEHHPDDLELTYFADPRRAEADLLEYQIDLACSHPITTSVLNSMGGLVLVLNEHRQAVAINDEFLKTLGISDPAEALGLRPGEAVECIHAATAPNGCGTGKACSTCGAVLAIVGSRRLQQPIERECLIARRHDGKDEPLEFLVRAAPLVLDDCRFTILTIVDIADKKRAQAVERMFVHDLLNCVQGLQGMCEMIVDDCADTVAEQLDRFQDLTDYLADMANSHRDLMLMEAGELRVRSEETDIEKVIDKIKRILTFTSIARNKSLVVEPENPMIRIQTDSVLLARVLLNMTKNALEASNAGDSVVFRCEKTDDQIRFSVWNPQEIPEQTAIRIFQRYFSTKPGNGRGLGTYSMKLIGERYLGGSVSFETSEAGTTFTFLLPLHSNMSAN